MPDQLVQMDVKKSVEWHGEWWQFYHGKRKLADLSAAPQGRNLTKGTFTGSENYRAHTICNALLDPRLTGEKAVKEALLEYRSQRERGQMRKEELTPSHSFHHYVPHSLILFFTFHARNEAQRPPHTREALSQVYYESIDWWQRELWLIRKFACKAGVVAPGARGIRRGENALAGRSPHRDQLLVFANSGRIESLPKDKGKHPATLMWSALRQAGFEEAIKPPSSPVKLMYPVTKATRADGSFTAWLPREAMVGLEKPQMVATWDGSTDHYSREPLEGIPGGELEVIGGC